MTADDTVTAKLAEWEALVEGATPGEWAVNSETMCTDGGEYTVYGIVDVDSATVTHDGAPAFAHTEGMGQADAEFIAAARTAMPVLLGFVREVRKGHEPEPEARAFDPLCCARCREEWPCPTEQAAQKWLGGEG